MLRVWIRLFLNLWLAWPKPTPASPISDFRYPDEIRGMSLAELEIRERAMAHAWQVLRQLNPTVVDRQAAMLEAWELGGRLRVLHWHGRGRRSPYG